MMRTLFLWYLLVVGIFCITARSSRRGLKRSHKNPLHRNIEDITTTSADEDIPKLSTKTKLIVLKPRSNEANEGRFFSHILLLQKLMQPQYGGNNYPNNNNNNYNNNNGLPYIFINNPTNLTNVNNNTLTNVPATATATATGTGGTGAAAIRYNVLSNSHALPYALPMPTEVHQQRQQAVPQVVYGPPINAVNFNKQPRNRNRNGNPNRNRNENNPFSKFTNNLKRITFL